MANANILRGGGGGVDCENATAAAGNVLAGKTFGTASSEELVSGSMVERGAVSHSLPINGTYTIPAGHHDGNGKVTQSIATQAATSITPSTSNQTVYAGHYMTGDVTIVADADFKATNIKSGVKIYAVTGSATSYYDSQTAWS